MLKEVFRKAIEITGINVKLNIVAWKEILITEKESIAGNALDELFSTAGEFQIKKDQKIYFFTGCTAPRFKVRQLCQKENMAIVRTSEKADVAIVGDQTSSELIKELWCSYVFGRDEIVNYLSDKQMNTSYLGLLSHINNNPEITEIMTHDYSAYSILRDETSTYYSEKFWTANENDLNNFDMVMDKGVQFVSQTSLLKHLSSGTVMTKDMYGELDNMFASSDTNNHTLAMEVMANCDYEKSALYLLQLLSENSNKISSSKQKNHVNFASLCKFFNTIPGQYLSLDQKIERLKNKKLITSAITQELLEMAAEDFNITERTYFKTVVTGTDELEEEIRIGDEYMKSREEPAPTLDELEENSINPQPFEYD